MNTEIERKFLIKDEFNNPRDLEFQLSISSELEGFEYIRQGYIMSDRGKTLRIRESREMFKESKYILCFKVSVDEMTKKEYEYEIPREDGIVLLENCKPNIVEKSRMKINHEGNIWEIDTFRGQNEGLIVAEIELKSKEDFFYKPKFIGLEVTFDKQYSNHYLSHKPWPTWKNK